MSTVHWVGAAQAVAQVHTGSIDSVDGTPADNTFTVTIGGISISQVGDTDVATTAAALVVLLNASTHPYFEAITWTNPSAGNIVGEADVAGVPFVATLTETGAGTGSVTDFAETTASAGPNHWDSPENWDGGAIPVSTDDIIIANASDNILWGLDQNAVAAASLSILKTFTGKIGLPLNSFATSADGDTVDSTVDEYRGTYLRISLAVLEIGKHVGPGTPAGSQRIKIDNTKASASVTTVFDTASAASEIGLPGVRLLAAHADADFFIRGGRAGVGFALDEPGETSTVGDINVSGNGLAYVGDGVTLTNFYQGGGTGVLQAAATVALVDVDGGTLTTEGDFTVTAMNVQGGTVNANHAKTAGNAITTATVSGGTLDGSGSRQARTWSAVNINGGSVVADNAVVTMTTLNQPVGPRTIAVS